ncbi:50S ribosomal protein L31 [Mycoplasma iguanae]|uniref:50S ribosomal protein L31 n=1 Tax=Mycoplasma iguanae TaxID=292461 RepID=A0ABY5RC08_9MOLU|nr:50S ribosomal protein L31 [Mycoplasma iguanae]UVD81867.1 50S ribosomal protein L31 [Mycoplasma iguanae]
MKKDIHPEYSILKLTCSTCNSEHSFGSTTKEASVDVCSKCHSFYTGDKNMAKATGRVDRFNKLVAKSQEKQNSK